MVVQATPLRLSAMLVVLSSPLASSLQSKEAAGERQQPRFATW